MMVQVVIRERETNWLRTDTLLKGKRRDGDLPNPVTPGLGHSRLGLSAEMSLNLGTGNGQSGSAA